MNAQSQLSIFDIQAGIHGRDAGIDQVISTNECFVSTMRGIARIIARRNGTVCADDLREIAQERGIEPNSANAWGAIFRGREWHQVGSTQSKLPSNHAREIKVWALVGVN